MSVTTFILFLLPLVQGQWAPPRSLGDPDIQRQLAGFVSNFNRKAFGTVNYDSESHPPFAAPLPNNYFERTTPNPYKPPNPQPRPEFRSQQTNFYPTQFFNSPAPQAPPTYDFNPSSSYGGPRPLGNRYQPPAQRPENLYEAPPPPTYPQGISFYQPNAGHSTSNKSPVLLISSNPFRGPAPVNNFNNYPPPNPPPALEVPNPYGNFYNENPPPYGANERPGYPETPSVPRPPKPVRPPTYPVSDGYEGPTPPPARPSEGYPEAPTPSQSTYPSPSPPSGYPETPSGYPENPSGYPKTPSKPQSPPSPEQPGYETPRVPSQPPQPEQPGYEVPRVPSQPPQPEQPGYETPGVPSQPPQPEQPRQPERPGVPSRPSPPELPRQPLQPSFPGQPQQPSPPGVPSQPPQIPGQPERPVVPSQPQPPAPPGVPSQPPQTPRQPQQPERPGSPPPQSPPQAPPPQPPPQPERPEGPSTPSPPGFPGRPERPGFPSQPIPPQVPEQPPQPEQPERPGFPSQPTPPQVPEQPPQPGQPERPGFPSQPTPPQVPEQPPQPGQPERPGFPSQPTPPPAFPTQPPQIPRQPPQQPSPPGVPSFPGQPQPPPGRPQEGIPPVQPPSPGQPRFPGQPPRPEFPPVPTRFPPPSPANRFPPIPTTESPFIPGSPFVPPGESTSPPRLPTTTPFRPKQLRPTPTLPQPPQQPEAPGHPTQPPEGPMVPNRIRGKAHVICEESGMDFNVKTIFPFTGQIFAHDRKRVPSCVHTFRNEWNINISFSYADCGIKNPGSESAAQTQYHLQIIVMFEQPDGTTTVQSFMAQCVHQKINYNKQIIPKRIEEALEELKLVPSKLEQKAPLPTTEMRVVKEVEHHGEGDGEEINDVNIGQPLRIEWSLKPESDAYGFIVRDCYVIDKVDGARHQVIDERGCSTDLNILGHPHYDTYHDIARSHWHAFKVPDSSELSIKCNIQICTDIADSESGLTSCDKIPTPPFCPDLVTSPSNSILFDVEGNLVKRDIKGQKVFSTHVHTDICFGNTTDPFCSGSDFEKTRLQHLERESKETSEKFCGSRLLIAAINGFSIWSLILAVVLNVAFIFRRKKTEREGR